MSWLDKSKNNDHSVFSVAQCEENIRPLRYANGGSQRTPIYKLETLLFSKHNLLMERFVIVGRG